MFLPAGRGPGSEPRSSPGPRPTGHQHNNQHNKEAAWSTTTRRSSAPSTRAPTGNATTSPAETSPPSPRSAPGGTASASTRHKQPSRNEPTSPTEESGELGIVEARHTAGSTNEYAIHLDNLLNHDGLVAAGAASHDRLTEQPRPPKPLTPVPDRVTADDIGRARAKHDRAAAEKQKQKAQEAQERAEFNKAYPGTKATARDWQKARQHATAQEITDGARAYANQCRRRETPARYIRTARRWLEDHDWENYQPAPAADTDDLLGKPHINDADLVNAEADPELMASIAAMWDNATNN